MRRFCRVFVPFYASIDLYLDLCLNLGQSIRGAGVKVLCGLGIMGEFPNFGSWVL
jgi:hypothetical protein